MTNSLPADGHITSNHVVDAVDKTADTIVEALRENGAL